MRELKEIVEDIPTVQKGKQARKLHKELKQYGRSLSIFDRYPCLLNWIIPIAASISTAILTAVLVNFMLGNL